MAPTGLRPASRSPSLVGALMMSRPLAGFLGIGAMGSAIALRMLATGHRLVILPGPRGSNIDRLSAAGAVVASEAVELTSCPFVFTCLPSSDIVAEYAREVFLPVAQGGFTHVDLTSGDPRTSLDLAASYAARGARFVDVAVSGTPEQAASGELTLLLGGDEASVQGLAPLLAAAASRVVPLGATGAAHRTKLIMAFIGMAIASASAEALAAARLSGIDLATLAGLIGETAMDSKTFQAMAAAAVDGDESRRRLSIANAGKDLGYLAALMAELHVAAPVAQATAATLRSAVELGHGEDYVTALTRLAIGRAGQAGA